MESNIILQKGTTPGLFVQRKVNNVSELFRK